MVGDVIGRGGRHALCGLLPGLRDELNIDFVTAQGENLAGGFGLTRNTVADLLDKRRRRSDDRQSRVGPARVRRGTGRSFAAGAAADELSGHRARPRLHGPGLRGRGQPDWPGVRGRVRLAVFGHRRTAGVGLGQGQAAARGLSRRGHLRKGRAGLAPGRGAHRRSAAPTHTSPRPTAGSCPAGRRS